MDQQPQQHLIYAPLNQAISDTESEEEIQIHNSLEHRQFQQLLYANHNGTSSQNPQNHYYMKRQLKKFDRNQQNQQISTDFISEPSTYTTNMQNSFHTVMSEMGYDANISNFETNTADNVAILGVGGNNSKDNCESQESSDGMSLARRWAFCSSLALCFFAVFGFVWLVPCNENSACPAPNDRIKTHNWLHNYTAFELKGGVNIVKGSREWERNLIFLYRGDKIFSKSGRNDSKQNGIISLLTRSGSFAWYTPTIDEPIAIDCNLIDVNLDDRMDCLVIDEYGELGAINSVTGKWFWRYQERSATKIDAYDFPIILPDLDDDLINDLLYITSETLEERTKKRIQTNEINTQRNILRILSGRTGEPLADGVKMHECDKIWNLILENSTVLYFDCIANMTASQQVHNLETLYQRITNKVMDIQKKLNSETIKITQHRYNRSNGKSERKVYSLNGRELTIENRGQCPHTCNVTIILTENINGKFKVSRNVTEAGVYGTIPEQWHFKNTKISGFVIKFWTWNNAVTTRKINSNSFAEAKNDTRKYLNKKYKINGTTLSEKNRQQDDGVKMKKTNSSNNLNDENVVKKDYHLFDKIVTKRETYSLPKELKIRAHTFHTATNVTIDKTTNNNNKKTKNFHLQMITESVMLILFVGTDTHIENVSQSTIVQFCRYDHNAYVCQPELKSQEHSIVVADLDQDGSQELVSYSSTFMQTTDNVDDWLLVSYVRLLRLQSELPPLIDQKKLN